MTQLEREVTDTLVIIARGILDEMRERIAIETGLKYDIAPALNWCEQQIGIDVRAYLRDGELPSERSIDAFARATLH